MKLDNTMFSMYRKCPKLYFERYESELLVAPDGRADAGGVPAVAAVAEAEAPRNLSRGIELIPDADSSTGREFGSRFHQLLELRHRRELNPDFLGPAPDVVDGPIERECQATFAQYCAHYIAEELQTISAEQTQTIKIPETPHELVVKIDRVVRFADGTIGPQDTKTEKTPGHNYREDWAGKTQASFYLWACQQLYPQERVSRLVVDVVTRGSAKRAPIFYRSDDITRTPEQLQDAIRNLCDVGNEIERHRREGWWPSNMNICKDGWRKCDYYPVHVVGVTDATLRLYRPAEQYLEL